MRSWTDLRTQADSARIQLRKLAHTIMNSSTILLPAWYSLLDDLVLPRKAIPRDVRTRWNSTYQMLHSCLEYREAIDQMTGERKFGLRKLEISEEEWDIAQELADVLKVRCCGCLQACDVTCHIRRPERMRARPCSSSLILACQCLALSYYLLLVAGKLCLFRSSMMQHSSSRVKTIPILSTSSRRWTA